MKKLRLGDIKLLAKVTLIRKGRDRIGTQDSQKSKLWSRQLHSSEGRTTKLAGF